MSAFLAGDLHIGHRNILKFETDSRPFETLDEMHDVMIERWNTIVRRKDDMVYVLGDVLLGSKHFLHVLEKMNGRKILIGGNHDSLRVEDYAKYFERVLGAKEKWNSIMTHIPVHEGQFHRYEANIHGHMHSKQILLEDGTPDPRYINVCLDNHDLYPVSGNWVRSKVEESKAFKAEKAFFASDK